MNGVEWHYAVGDTQYGPVSLSTLRTLVQSGQVGSTDLVWKDGMAQWAEARTVRELSVPAAGLGGPPPVPGGGGPGLMVRRDKGTAELALRQARKRPTLATMAAGLAWLAGGIALLLSLGLMEEAEELAQWADQVEDIDTELLAQAIDEERVAGFVSAALGAMSLLAGTMMFVGASGCRAIMAISSVILTGFCVYNMWDTVQFSNEWGEPIDPMTKIMQWFLLACAISPLFCILPSEVGKWVDAKQGRMKPGRRAASMPSGGGGRPMGGMGRGRRRR